MFFLQTVSFQRAQNMRRSVAEEKKFAALCIKCAERESDETVLKRQMFQGKAHEWWWEECSEIILRRCSERATNRHFMKVRTAISALMIIKLTSELTSLSRLDAILWMSGIKLLLAPVACFNDSPSCTVCFHSSAKHGDEKLFDSLVDCAQGQVHCWNLIL